MVAKSNILTAAKVIESALYELVANGASTKVHVFEADWGNLRALIGSDGFKGMSLGRRQEVVWEFLRDRVPKEHLDFLKAVHPFDIDEYDANVAQA